ncbi:MAG: hypothetical protein JW881_07500 [Spirochaetales bacterium]|nr:hypothetical protein [Spirochaetales bacterium]
MGNRHSLSTYIVFLLCFIPVLVFLPLSCHYFDPLHPYGHIVYWSKSYGAVEDEQMNSIISLSGDDNVIAGYTDSFGMGGEDSWIIGLDQEGDVCWEKAYGTEDKNERISRIITTSSDDLVVAGNMYDRDIEIGSDIWVMKCDGEGNILWENCIGGSQGDEAMWIDETADGGFILAGKSESFATDTSKGHDALLVKFGPNGEILWRQIFGGAGYDEACVVQAVDDDCIIFGGNTSSFGSGDSDFWVVKTDSLGKVIWEKRYGKSGDDRLCSLIHTSDNGCIVTGHIDSADFSENENEWILQIIKISSQGGIMWQKAFVYESSVKQWTELTHSIDETEDGNFIIAVTTELVYGKGLDCHILKIDRRGNILWQKAYGGSENDFILSVKEMPDNGYLLAGKTYSFDVQRADSWILKILPNGECHPLDYIPSFKTGSIVCDVSDTESSTERINTPSISIMRKITVTETSCTVKQQAPVE